MSLFGEMLKTIQIQSFNDLLNYEPNNGIKLLVQIFHRITAWVLVGSIAFFAIKNIHYLSVKLFISILIIQIALGIITVSYSIGKIPAFWGVVHQGVAFLLLANWVFLFYIRKK
jgi:heme A synthase